MRHNFQLAQKAFDKSYRYFQRKHKADNFLNFENDNSNDIWKKLKSLTEPKKEKIALEIIRNDGTISSDLKEVLYKWHHDFSDSFSKVKK